jgi:transposase-like protein
MAIGLIASAAALRDVVCPHCKAHQARARKPVGESYRCSKCHKLFPVTSHQGQGASRSGKRKR